MLSIHVRLSQVVCVSMPDAVFIMVKFNVTTLSQPCILVNVKVGVLVLEVYFTLSIHVRLSHTVYVSVVAEFRMVKFNVTKLSQPLAAPPIKVKVGVLVLVV